MAKQNSLNIQDYLNDDVMDSLAETLDGVIENIQSGCVSEALKAKNGSGDPTTGSVEYKRFANAVMITISGKQIPTAPSAFVPTSGIRAIYTRSTMLYNKFKI